jgi:cell division protein FtsB
MSDPVTATRIVGSLASVIVVALVGFFVWLANLATRVSVIEQTIEIRQEAAKLNQLTNQEAVNRIEHEREANDARVRDDLKELRQHVFR